MYYDLLTYRFNRKPDWGKKIKNVFFSNFKGNSSTRYGAINEPKARKLYENLSNTKIIKLRLFVHPDAPWLGFSADGVIHENSCVIEIKCPIKGKKVTSDGLIKNLKYFRQTISRDFFLRTNHKYYEQMQLGMALLNLNKCHFITEHYSSAKFLSKKNSIFVNIEDNELVLSYKYVSHKI